MKRLIERRRLSRMAELRLAQALRAHQRCAQSPCVHRCTMRVPWKDDDYVVFQGNRTVIVLQGTHTATIYESQLQGGKA